jgi:hypothetical protein
MRARLLLTALVAVLVTAASVSAAAARSAKDLILHASDVPAGAKRISFGGAKGTIKIPRTVHGQEAYVAYRFKNGSKAELVASAAGILANTRDAHDVFVSLRKKVIKGGGFRRLSVRKYGDEQVTLGVAVRAASVGIILVRSGATLWEVAVSAYPGFSKAKQTSELEKYASKGKARAG